MAKSCGDCTVCCTSILYHEVYGQKIGDGVDCRFISTSDEKCAIYDFRPEQCVGFKCDWLVRESWPENLRPDISGMLCYTNKKSGSRVIYTKQTKEEDKKFIEEYFSSKNEPLKKYFHLYSTDK